MDSGPLIDFSSPEQKRTDTLLIPECVGASSFILNGSVKYSISEEESNPFDFVDCQVAANKAAENDPFEMVFNDAMQCKESYINKFKFSPESALSTVGENTTTPEHDRAPIHKDISSGYATGVKMSVNDCYDVSKPAITKLLRDNAAIQEGDSPKNAIGKKLSVVSSNSTSTSVCSDSCQHNRGTEERSFLNLDDILPPDSLFNSTCDTSSFFDDTQPANSCYLALDSDVCLNERDELRAKFGSITTENDNPQDSGITPKSEEELRLSAKSQVGKLNCKSRLEGQNDWRHSLVERRRSATAPMSVSLESLFPENMFFRSSKDFMKGFSDLGKEAGMPSDFSSSRYSVDEKFGKMNLYNELKPKADCEPSRSLLEKLNKIQEQTEMQSSLQALSKESPSCWNLKQWSQKELDIFDLSLSDLTPFKKSCTEDSVSRTTSNNIDFDSSLFKESTLPSKEDDPVSVTLPKQDVTSTPSSVEARSEKGGRRRSLSVDLERAKKSSVSPLLRTVPLCADALQNLSLCSKVSPGPICTATNDRNNGGNAEDSHVTLTLKEKNLCQPKLFLRKPTFQSKAQSKMAPMKATAPIQNMTRVKSSPLAASVRQNVSLTRTSIAGKPILKESCSKLVLTSRGSLGMPQSPRHHIVNSPVINVVSQRNKLPTRLPSPRRSAGAINDSMQSKKRTEFAKGKNSQLPGPPSSLVSSPRIPHKSSPLLRSGSNGRVLTDINSCQTSWKSPKRRLIQLDPARRNRSLLNDKENL